MALVRAQLKIGIRRFTAGKFTKFGKIGTLRYEANIRYIPARESNRLEKPKPYGQQRIRRITSYSVK